MTKEINNDYLKLLTDFHVQASAEIFTKKIQYEQWLGKLFYLNDALHKQYDLFYQELFWIVLYQLLTEGNNQYLNKTVILVKKINEPYEKKWYNRLRKGLLELKDQFTTVEFEYLEYRRHNSCHIFQQDYSVFKKDNSLKNKKEQNRKKRSVINIELEFFSVLQKYGGDTGFDTHFRIVLYPIINQLNIDLNTIQEEDMNKKEINE
ncbi:MAG TPA: hypothetical protein DDZ96_04825 [Porphyromonadaceae bacterium]|jgi:hypothetical protein|nr:hypothetical protein [Porphyromonadaceae bacterium]HBX20917.1 hypothetical protein [Porphyromonadaceae bacterium]HCM22372.1 hypothetical protein [Porphyromonadaceae bacterium]